MELSTSFAGQHLEGRQDRCHSAPHALPASSRTEPRPPVASLSQQGSSMHQLTASLAGRVRGGTRRRQPSQVVCCAAAAATVQSLADLPLQPILNVQGLIQPDVPEGTQASIFAIYDDQRTLQFVGLSKDVRNSLRTVFSRRPEKSFFFKSIHFDTLDQAALVGAQKQWFAELGGPPPGNKLELERRAWAQPVNAGALNTRGMKQAAESKMVEMMTAIKARGCKEDFIPDPKKIEEGLVEFLPSKAMTAEEKEEQRGRLAALERQKHTVTGDYKGETISFDLFFKDGLVTNGGMMYDINVTYDEMETIHRVIIGKPYYEGHPLGPEEVLEKTFLFLLGKRTIRQTEGLLACDQFPINYFSLSTVEQYFEDFKPWWEASTGAAFPGDGKFWRFNRIHDYANKGNSPENLEGLSMSLDRIHPLASDEAQGQDWSVWAPLAQ